MKIYKKDYKTKADKIKFIKSKIAGREYAESIIYNDIIDYGYEEEYSLPVKDPEEVERYIHNHFFSIVNKNFDQIFESIWEDFSYA